MHDNVFMQLRNFDDYYILSLITSECVVHEHIIMHSLAKFPNVNKGASFYEHIVVACDHGIRIFLYRACDAISDDGRLSDNE